MQEEQEGTTMAGAAAVEVEVTVAVGVDMAVAAVEDALTGETLLGFQSGYPISVCEIRRTRQTLTTYFPIVRRNCQIQRTYLSGVNCRLP